MYAVFGERSRRRTKAPAKKPKGRAAVQGMITIGTTVRRPVAAEAYRKKMSPNELALEKLNEALLDYPNANAALRRQFRDEFANSEQLRYMNMQTLAGALMFIYNLGAVSELRPEDFNDTNLDPILIRVMPPQDPKATREQITESRRKHKESLLRYVRHVILYRITRQEQFQQGLIGTVPEIPEGEEPDLLATNLEGSVDEGSAAQPEISTS